jgi:cytochrome c oxidase assembly protein subunit 11
VRNHKKYIVKFEGQAEPGINWEFEPVEQQVIIGPSETAIVFYRLYNKEDKPIVGFSTYNISPEEANIYFSKIQCFCFNQQMVNPK